MHARFPFSPCLLLALAVGLSPTPAWSATGGPPRPKILGVAHAAFYVSDMAKARSFYEGFLGFASPFSISRKGGGEMVSIKINDRQSVELYPASEVAPLK